MVIEDSVSPSGLINQTDIIEWSVQLDTTVSHVNHIAWPYKHLNYKCVNAIACSTKFLKHKHNGVEDLAAFNCVRV